MPRSRRPLLASLAHALRCCLRALALRQMHSHAWLKKR